MCMSSPKMPASTSAAAASAAAPLIGTSSKDNQSSIDAMAMQRKKQQSAFSFNDTLIASAGFTPQTSAKKLLGL